MNIEVVPFAEVDLFEAMRAARKHRDLPDIHPHRKLRRIARRHSAQMAQSTSLAHSKDLIADIGRMSFRCLGENIGVNAIGDVVSPFDGEVLYTISVEEAATKMHEAWMESSSHRRNLLRPGFTRAGIGVFRDESRMWATVVFWG